MRTARSNLLLVFVAVLAGVVGFFVQRHVGGANADSPVLGKPRIDFSLKDTDGRERRLSEWDGKVVVVNFWATWCPPCRKEIPDFVKLQSQYGSQGLQFLGVAIDNLKAVREFMANAQMNYPVLLGDEDGAITRRYGNELGALPYTVVIDRQGKVIATRRGQFHRTEAEAAIRELL